MIPALLAKSDALWRASRAASPRAGSSGLTRHVVADSGLAEVKAALRGEHRGGGLEFVARDLAELVRQVPLVSERVAELALAGAPELVLE
jgi:hypothetical protein